jgi:hypothetical protein
MTEEEYRGDLLSASASRAEVQGCGQREAFVEEVLERLREAGEAPDSEACAEMLVGHRSRRLEIDAWAEDEADDSLHLFVAILDGGPQFPGSLNLTEAREQGFNRLLGVYEQARDGWLKENIEESRPLWALARRIQTAPVPSALRLHVLTDRPISERVREIAGDETREGVPVTFQIWDLTRLKRIHDAHSIRDDLIVDFSNLPGGGLPALPASLGSGDYEGYLAVVPGEVLADIYVRHGSRLLEGNVRTFLGRSGKVNKGIAATIANEPEKFFAYNNGIAATASEVTTVRSREGGLIIVSATDLQIVNGAQTTASLASAAKSLVPGAVFVPLKLSVVTPKIGTDLIPLISRFANSQNGVRPSDFFANHQFHRRMEEVSRRILAPTTGGSQMQTSWYYERARGQYLNDQAAMTQAKRNLFTKRTPRNQVISKTDLAKIECCFDLEPDVACRGAEKAFVVFAERIAKEWEDESKRALYGDEWFRAAVAKVILFRAAEAIVSRASWYEGGYRAQIVAYACARLARLALDQSGGGGLDYSKVWTRQAAGEVLEEQIEVVAEAMAAVLRNPPHAGQNISEWAKQQGCRKPALEAPVEVVDGFDRCLISRDDERAGRREQRSNGRIESALGAVTRVMEKDIAYWEALRRFCRTKRLLLADDERALVPACRPGMTPSDRQAEKLLKLVERAEARGWSHEGPAA